jgi:hypothetical protein
MVDIFVTDSRAKYDQRSHADSILYLDGFIGACSFADQAAIEAFNNTLVGLDDEACRLMLDQLDKDTQTIISKGWTFKANRFISARPDQEKIHSTLFNFHKHFVVKKYLFQLVLDRFFDHFSIPVQPLVLYLSEHYYLTQDLPYAIISSSYYPAFKNTYFKFLARQAYYFARRIFFKTPAIEKAQIAIILFDIHNEFDLFKKFMELARQQNKVAITIIVVDSGNPQEKKVDTTMYADGNVKVVNLFDQKVNLISDYSSFYSVCKKLNPLYSIYKKARFCEWEDIQYGFTDNVISQLSPDVCLYVNIQEYGRVVANVCASHDVTSVCVEYAFAFDTYTMEKRIRFDARACMSEVTAQNWVRHKDPSPRREIVGFCKIDDWQEKLAVREKASHEKPFDNKKRTILFVSTWAPNPNSPLLTEKAKIVEKLSEVCFRNNWNLLIKKHPSEFDTLVGDVFGHNKYPDQRIVEHNEMTLFDCVYYADFVCTQNSSAFVEALYLNKPFSYITANGENLWANLSYFSREKAVGTFGSVEEYEQYVLANAREEAYQKVLDEFMKLQAKFLYKTDGKASERLLALAESFVR